MEWEGPFFFSLLTDFFLVVGKHSIDNSQFLIAFPTRKGLILPHLQF